MPARVSWFTPFNGTRPHREHRSRRGRKKNLKESKVILEHLKKRISKRENKRKLINQRLHVIETGKNLY